MKGSTLKNGRKVAMTETSFDEKLKTYDKGPISDDNFFQVSPWYWWLIIIFGLSMHYEVAFNPDRILAWDIVGIKDSMKWLGLFLFRQQIILQYIFYLAIATHIAEACYAYYYSYQRRLKTKLLWFMQTLFLGFASLNLLLEYDQKKI